MSTKCTCNVGDPSWSIYRAGIDAVLSLGQRCDAIDLHFENIVRTTGVICLTSKLKTIIL